MFTERIVISQFDIRVDGYISVRKTTEILRNGTLIAQLPPWRCVLAPNDPQAAEVLGDEPLCGVSSVFAVLAHRSTRASCWCVQRCAA